MLSAQLSSLTAEAKPLQPNSATTDLNIKTFRTPPCMQRMFCTKREVQAWRWKNFLCFSKGNAIVPQKCRANPELFCLRVRPPPSSDLGSQ